MGGTITEDGVRERHGGKTRATASHLTAGMRTGALVVVVGSADQSRIRAKRNTCPWQLSLKIAGHFVELNPKTGGGHQRHFGFFPDGWPTACTEMGPGDPGEVTGWQIHRDAQCCCVSQKGARESSSVDIEIGTVG